MRRAFTLVEVMVALVITGLVVTLAWGTARAGFDVEDRIGALESGLQAESQARVFLSDALRHALPGARGAGAVFELTDSTQNGVPTDALAFDTRGVEPPLGAGTRWRVVVQLSDGALVLTARGAQGQTWSGRVPGVHGLDIRVLPRDDRAPWRDQWDEPDLAPRAVSLALLDAGGRPSGAPLVQQLGLEPGTVGR